MQVTIAPEYIERFRLQLAALEFGNDDRLLLAVSGGPDSLALLLLAHAWAPDRIAAATVNHQLRVGSADEAAYVGKICADLKVQHRIVAPSDPIKGNIQSEARQVRYKLLAETAEDFGCALVATAHHADDQLETLLMRLGRGSGVNGMAGIRARNGNVVRPLLHFSKTELEEICSFANVPPIRDPSNENAAFDRVAMRQWLAKGSHPFETKAAMRSASAFADAAEALDWMATALAEGRIRRDTAQVSLDIKGLPIEMKRRLLMLALCEVSPDIAPRGEAVERLLFDLHEGRTSTIGNVICRGGNLWTFAAAPPRRNSQ